MLSLLDENGQPMSCADVAELLGLSLNQVEFAIKERCIKTVDELSKIHRSKTGDLIYPINQRKYKTKFGELTARQVFEIHEFTDHPDPKLRLSFVTLSGRLSRRGGMCETLWWERMSSGAFMKRMKELGMDVYDKTQQAPNKPQVKRTKGFNRTSTCFRKNATEIEVCKTYHTLTECFGNDNDLPTLCLSARGSECSNFTGRML